MGELKFPTSHEWHIPKAKLSPTNGLAEVVKKNSPTSGEAYATCDSLGILIHPFVASPLMGEFPVTNSPQCVIWPIPIDWPCNELPRANLTKLMSHQVIALNVNVSWRSKSK